jgi:20S proteasome alpha/beta subunit
MNTVVRLVRPSPYPPIRKPYTPPKPSERGIPKMTVAMGIRCMRGVVLCADTLVTLPRGGKSYESEIFEIRKDFGCYMACAGDVYMAKEIVAKVRSLASSAESPDKCLEIANCEYSEALSQEEKKEPDLRSFVEFLISIRRRYVESDRYETSLYHLYGDRIYPIEQYAVIGIGDEMARALCDGRAFPVNLIGCTFVGVDTIRRVKNSVTYCGGETTVVEIHNSKEEPFDAYTAAQIMQIEADYGYLDEQLNILRLAFLGASNEDFDAYISLLNRNLREHRSLPDRFKFPSSI